MQILAVLAAALDSSPYGNSQYSKQLPVHVDTQTAACSSCSSPVHHAEATTLASHKTYIAPQTQ
jgi:hypothetical protein